ncbi:MAG: DUF6141 family protein [Planctomycetota bacterium]|jgi:hypothetical protein
MNQKDNPVFYEQQRFSSWLCLTLVCSLVAAVVILVSVVAVAQHPVDAGDIVSIIVGGIAATAIVPLFLLAKLETEVHSDRLRVRLFPFHIRHREIAAEDLSECYPRTYKPIREYGGWGIRCGFRRGVGRAYNMKGNQGVQLVFKDGKRLLIGSQKPDELAQVIKSTMKNP